MVFQANTITQSFGPWHGHAPSQHRPEKFLTNNTDLPYKEKLNVAPYI
ncbi:hypothetical protein C4K04_5151 [Pseudomonas chlororaphis]|uniref:Uncharacterized protein n=1 Tax=Pseudomonas chlororaphis TaxID=587753 RepID=A0A3G7TV79_9PSED|nr:hypothetical protein C4K04_5151 [Pseudomonas chlororaphis]